MEPDCSPKEYVNILCLKYVAIPRFPQGWLLILMDDAILRDDAIPGNDDAIARGGASYDATPRDDAIPVCDDAIPGSDDATPRDDAIPGSDDAT